MKTKKRNVELPEQRRQRLQSALKTWKANLAAGEPAPAADELRKVVKNDYRSTRKPPS